VTCRPYRGPARCGTRQGARRGRRRRRPGRSRQDVCRAAASNGATPPDERITSGAESVDQHKVRQARAGTGERRGSGTHPPGWAKTAPIRGIPARSRATRSRAPPGSAGAARSQSWLRVDQHE